MQPNGEPVPFGELRKLSSVRMIRRPASAEPSPANQLEMAECPQISPGPMQRGASAEVLLYHDQHFNDPAVQQQQQLQELQQQMVEIAQRWNLRFSGDGESKHATKEFIRGLRQVIHHLGECQLLTHWPSLFHVLTMCFADSALEWYSSRSSHIESLEQFYREFRERFMPWQQRMQQPDEVEQPDDDEPGQLLMPIPWRLLERKQRPGESVSAYMAEVNFLYSSNTNFPEANLVSVVYNNLLPECRGWMTPFTEQVTSLKKLQELACLYEAETRRNRETERQLEQVCHRLESQSIGSASGPSCSQCGAQRHTTDGCPLKWHRKW